MTNDKGNKKREPSILQDAVTSLAIHAALVGGGIDNEQAMRISFGDKTTDAVLEANKEIGEEQNNG